MTSGLYQAGATRALVCAAVMALVLVGGAQVRAESRPSRNATEPPELAEQGRGERRGRGAPPPGTTAPLNVREVEQMWDTLVAAEARTVLGFANENQFMRFGRRLQNLQNVRRRLQRQRNALRNELNQLVGGRGPVENREAVLAKLDEFDAFSEASAREVRQAIAAIDQILSLRQRVRFRSFDERMAQRKLELLSQARAAARGRAAGRGGGGR